MASSVLWCTEKMREEKIGLVVVYMYGLLALLAADGWILYVFLVTYYVVGNRVVAR